MQLFTKREREREANIMTWNFRVKKLKVFKLKTCSRKKLLLFQIGSSFFSFLSFIFLAFVFVYSFVLDTYGHRKRNKIYIFMRLVPRVTLFTFSNSLQVFVGSEKGLKLLQTVTDRENFSRYSFSLLFLFPLKRGDYFWRVKREKILCFFFLSASSTSCVWNTLIECKRNVKEWSLSVQQSVKK